MLNYNCRLTRNQYQNNSFELHAIRKSWYQKPTKGKITNIHQRRCYKIQAKDNKWYTWKHFATDNNWYKIKPVYHLTSHQNQHFNFDTEIWIIKLMEFQKLEVVQTFWITLPGFITLVHQTNSDTTQTLRVTYTVEDMQGPTKLISPLTRLGNNSLPQLLLYCWDVTRIGGQDNCRIIWPAPTTSFYSRKVGFTLFTGHEGP
jgi:hypothetical protein